VKTSATVGDLMFLNNVRFIYLVIKKNTVPLEACRGFRVP